MRTRVAGRRSPVPPGGVITDYPGGVQGAGDSTTHCAKPKAKCAAMPKNPGRHLVVLLKKT